MSPPEAPLLTVRTLDHPGGVELVLEGELDIATLPVAQGELRTALGTAPSALVLDLSRLDFIDSSGIRLALLAEHDARAARCRFAVRLGDGLARRLFDSLGLTGRFPVTSPGQWPD